MSVEERDPTVTERLSERPRLDPGKILKTPARGILIRFLTGALTSAVAGLITLGFGSRTGGIFLAFPGILVASLTLIEQQEDDVSAREDARGAIVGGGAMVAFALTVALVVGHVPGGLALLFGALAWLVFALGGYAILWLR
jgi:hypothetical protein